jgi:hypothetical protein
MSLKALARERLAIIRSGETTGKTCFTQQRHPQAPVKQAKPQESAENDACFTVSPPREQNDETGVKRRTIDDGLRVLSGRTPPRGVPADRWAEVRADALRLHRDGWSNAALELGWDVVQLFGCSSTDDPADEGLAVQLAGRRPLLLDASSAIIADGRQRYCVFNVRPRPEALMLWDV